MNDQDEVLYVATRKGKLVLENISREMKTDEGIVMMILLHTYIGEGDKGVSVNTLKARYAPLVTISKNDDGTIPALEMCKDDLQCGKNVVACLGSNVKQLTDKLLSRGYIMARDAK